MGALPEREFLKRVGNSDPDAQEKWALTVDNMPDDKVFEVYFATKEYLANKKAEEEA